MIFGTLELMPGRKSKVKGQRSKVDGKAFSLIELLLAIALIGLVVAVAIPNLRQFSGTQEIDAAASQLINTLRTAQSSAASNIKCPDGDISSGWNVVLTTNSYSLNAGCVAPLIQQTYTSAYAPAPGNAATFTMTSEPCISQSLTLVFTNSQLSYLCNGVISTTWPVTIKLEKPGVFKKVVIEQGGVIRAKNANEE